MSPPFEVRRWLHLQMSQLVGRCTSRRVYLDRGLDAVPYSGTDREVSVWWVGYVRMVLGILIICEKERHLAVLGYVLSDISAI